MFAEDVEDVSGLESQLVPISVGDVDLDGQEAVGFEQPVGVFVRGFRVAGAPAVAVAAASSEQRSQADGGDRDRIPELCTHDGEG